MDGHQLQRISRKLVEYLETGNPPAGLFCDDVFCDFIPPLWRIQARGLENMLKIREHGHPEHGQVEIRSAAPTAEGFVMEVEERWSNAKGNWYCREALIAQTRGDSIARISVYCTGDWDASRQETHRKQVVILEP